MITYYRIRRYVSRFRKKKSKKGFFLSKSMPNLQFCKSPVIKKGKARPITKDVAKGWLFIQNRQIGMLPLLDADLFYRLLEVLGR